MRDLLKTKVNTPTTLPYENDIISQFSLKAFDESVVAEKCLRWCTEKKEEQEQRSKM